MDVEDINKAEERRHRRGRGRGSGRGRSQGRSKSHGRGRGQRTASDSERTDSERTDSEQMDSKRTETKGTDSKPPTGGRKTKQDDVDGDAAKIAESDEQPKKKVKCMCGTPSFFFFF